MNKRLRRGVFYGLFIPLSSNIPLLIYGLYTLKWCGGIFANPISLGILLIAILGFWLCINILPYYDKNSPGLRFTVMRGGCTLGSAAIYGFLVQIVIYIKLYPHWESLQIPVLIGNMIYSIVINLIILWNGILRIFFTSVRLRLRTRIIMVLAMWIPLVNAGVLLYAMKLVRAEYDFACYKDNLRTVRAESDICKTKYPLILVHGIGFRDIKYFNYWGRIPKELTRYGATIYYGNQEALGTIAYNAEDIRNKIQEVLKETGCDKVNIIAHSKGGLDSRYAISCLGMAPYTASLTTVCTPHRGCRFVDYACRLPDGLYRFVANCFNKTFLRFGDKNPDFYNATHQFSTKESQRFNNDTPDMPEVYYQSYATVMKGRFADPLLWIPYSMIKPLEGENDGLVSIDSAKWGEFQGVLRSTGRRGISHGDIIDLKREDYKGFDVVECYVQIVKGLVEKGF